MIRLLFCEEGLHPHRKSVQESKAQNSQPTLRFLSLKKGPALELEKMLALGKTQEIQMLLKKWWRLKIPKIPKIPKLLKILKILKILEILEILKIPKTLKLLKLLMIPKLLKIPKLQKLLKFQKKRRKGKTQKSLKK